MASAAVKEEEKEDLCCPVCSEVFSRPKLLACGHLLCRRCLLSWIEKQLEAGCPLCRYVIMDPKDRASGKSFEDVADTLPDDISMETLVASHRLLSQDQECQACVTQPATSICTTCRDVFCASCAAGHKRMSVSRHHTVEQLSSMTPEKLASSHPSFCSTHRDKIAEVFCSTHGVSICMICATTGHRQCPDMSPLETKMEEARAALADMRAKLRNEEAHLNEAVQQLDQHLQDMKEKVKVTAAEIEAMCERLQSSIEACRKRLNDLMHRACDDVEDAVNEAKTCLFQRRGRLTVHDRVAKRAEGSADVIDMSSSLTTRVQSLNCSSVLPPEAKVVSTFSLLVDQEAVARVEQQISQLGQLKDVPADLLAQPAKVPPANAKKASAKPAVWTFNDKKKGYGVVLSNNQQTAESTTVWDHGIVLSCEPMEVNCLYQVRVDQTDSNYADRLLGVMTKDIDSVTLPHWSHSLTSAVVVEPDWVTVNGTQRASQVGSSLQQMKEGGRVGLMLDNNRTLHLYIDDQPQGEVEPHLPHPCYFVVDLVGYWKKVTALPAERLL